MDNKDRKTTAQYLPWHTKNIFFKSPDKSKFLFFENGQLFSALSGIEGEF